MVESGVYLDEALRHLAFGHGVDPRGNYRVCVKAGIEGDISPVRRFIAITVDDEIAVLRIDGTPQSPSESVFEVTRPALMGRRLGGRVGEDRTGPWLSTYLRALAKQEGVERENEGLIWIDSFSVEGPYYPEQRNFFDELIYPGNPGPKKPVRIPWNDANARGLIERFAFEAFRRRKPAPKYIDGLQAYFQQKRGKGATFQDAMIDTLAVVMASPSFLYLNEAEDGAAESRSIDSREHVVRLAYFLTGGPPDDPLYRAAKEGALSDPKAYGREIDRLLRLADRARFAESFAPQWADFNRLDSISFSDVFYPTFTPGLRHSMKQEVVGGKKMPVRISGSLPDEKPFRSFSEFRGTMLRHHEDLARNMLESLLVYALGRDIEFTDEPYIEAMMEGLRPDDFRMRDMLHAVAESPLFTHN